MDDHPETALADGSGRRGHRLPLLACLALLLGVAIHTGQVIFKAWPQAQASGSANDFATYYWAVQVAVEGGDPYDAAELRAAAAESGFHGYINPYLYPPPFLWLLLWTRPLEILVAYRIWFWANSLFLLAAVSALWLWIPGPRMAFALGASLPLVAAITDNQVMGQANMLVLAMTLWAAVLAHRGHARLGGVLLGAGLVMKPVPLALLLLWTLRGRWVSIGFALLSAVTLLVIASFAFGMGIQGGVAHYAGEVMPSLFYADYNGLEMTIGGFANHSIANLWARAFPFGDPRRLSDTARIGVILSNVGLIASIMIALRRPPADQVSCLAALAAVLCAVLVTPLFTFEHHLVFVLPAVVAVLGAYGRRLPYWTLAFVLPALGMLAWDIHSVTHLCQATSGGTRWLLAEGKFLAIGCLGIVSCRLARAQPGQEPSSSGP